MDNAAGSEKKSLDIVGTVKGVITAPVDFYRAMPKAGGFGDPLIFALVMGVISGVIQAVLGLFHFGAAASTMGALAFIIIAPIWIVIGSFIGAAIMFVVWKLMGSNESYETAYRCGAFAAAISPITSVLGLIPYVGGILGMVWMLYLIVTASVEVHKLPSQKAWTVFGIITAVFALLSLSGQCAARKVQRDVGDWQKQLEGSSGEINEAAKTFSAAMKAAQAQANAEVAKAQAEAAKAQAEAAKAQAEAAKAQE